VTEGLITDRWLGLIADDIIGPNDLKHLVEHDLGVLAAHTDHPENFGIWGLAFKPNTDDMRNAPSIDIIEKLHDDGAVIQAYDPESTDTAKEAIGKKVTYQKNKYDTLKDADALVIMTDWDEFKDPDWKKVRSLLNSPIIIDGRNMFKPQDMEKLGFVYHSVGRG